MEWLNSMHTFILITFTCLSFLAWIGLMCHQVGMVHAKNVTTLLLTNLCGFGIAAMVLILFTFELINPQQPVANDIYQPLFSFLQALVNTPDVREATTLSPAAMNLLYVMMAAVLVSLISGITSERLKLWSYFLFTVLLISMIYPVLAYWVWGKGFLKNIGFIDHGGACIYLAAATCGLIGTKILGPRLGRFARNKAGWLYRPSNMPLVVIGGAFFLLGACALHAATALAFAGVNDMSLLSGVFLQTLVAGFSAFIASLFVTRVFWGRADVTMSISGMIAGVAIIAADPVHVTQNTALVFGLIAGVVAVLGIRLFEALQWDDPAGYAAALGFGSLLGFILVTFVQDYAQLSQMYQKTWVWHDQLLAQLSGIAVIFSWIAVTTTLAWLVVHYLIGLRISPEIEEFGLDVHDCGMSAYPEFTSTGR